MAPGTEAALGIRPHLCRPTMARTAEEVASIIVNTSSNNALSQDCYTGHPWLAPDIKERGIDELSPIWNVMDLTREGRGTFYTKLEYPGAA